MATVTVKTTITIESADDAEHDGVKTYVNGFADDFASVDPDTTKNVIVIVAKDWVEETAVPKA